MLENNHKASFLLDYRANIKVLFLGNNNMPQIIIDVDDEITQRIQEVAKQEGISQSHWVAKLIEQCLVTDWPESVKELVGAWTDVPEAKELRHFGEDISRENF